MMEEKKQRLELVGFKIFKGIQYETGNRDYKFLSSCALNKCIIGLSLQDEILQRISGEHLHCCKVWLVIRYNGGWMQYSARIAPLGWNSRLV